MPETLLPLLLAVQGFIGGIDTLVNQEWLTHLPRRAQARTEVGIHVLREASYGLLFAALAWLSWHGAGCAARRLAGRVYHWIHDEYGLP